MTGFSIFRLVPAASPSDPRWDLAPWQGEVVVRARSPAAARIIAAAVEVDFPEANAKPGDGVQTDFASAFRDEKLYHAVEDRSGAFATDGEAGVVAGTPTRNVIAPTIDADNGVREGARIKVVSAK